MTDTPCKMKLPTNIMHGISWSDLPTHHLNIITRDHGHLSLYSANPNPGRSNAISDLSVFTTHFQGLAAIYLCPLRVVSNSALKRDEISVAANFVPSRTQRRICDNVLARPVIAPKLSWPNKLWSSMMGGLGQHLGLILDDFSNNKQPHGETSKSSQLLQNMTL